MARIEVLVTILLAVIGFLTFEFRSHSKLDERYLKRVKELQDEGWVQVSTELRKLFVDAENFADQDELDDEYGDLTRNDRIEFYIQKEVDRGELSPIENSLLELDRPRELYETARSKLWSSIKWCLITSIILIVGLFVLFVAEGSDEESIAQIVFLTSLFSGIFTLDRFWDYMRSKSKLDNIWDDYYIDS